MNHSCTESRKENLATPEQPFHFSDSGLSNVNLVGIRYYTCECGRILAEIPEIKKLMQLIARELLRKKSSLVGEEVRFLRKRLGKKQAEFARAISVEPETLSRYENDKQPVSEPVDKLIRVYYLAFSDDPDLAEIRKALSELIAQQQTPAPKKIVAHVSERDEWEEVEAG
jgi:putative zinc finger/helix-turn-helix YgiT family protein